jgi:hypothetical protein
VLHDNERSSAAPRSAVLIVACALAALVALGLAALTSMELYFFGFPDGHVTDYEKAVGTPLTILAGVEAGLGVLFAALAFAPRRVRGVGLLAAVIGLVAVVTVTEVGVPWYFGTHLGLDNGIGG